MSIGPVEYMIVAFPGNEFKGEILPELARLQDTNTIRIIDLAIVVKDEDGNAQALEATDLDSEFGKALSDLLGNESGGLLNTDDLMAAADELDNNSSAALLVWEDVWATTLRDAIVHAGGELWDLERVPGEVVQAAVDFAGSN
ncbi:MAG TPA: DUF6325 family protein [Acidimicrobiales bacterium]|jgi:hypothetical protein